MSNEFKISELSLFRIKMRVMAFNKAHTLIKQYAPSVREWLRPLVGRKLFKATGGLYKGIVKPELPNEVYLDLGTYSIKIDPRVSCGEQRTNQFGHSNWEHEKGGFSCHMADMDSQTGVVKSLPEVNHEDFLRTDYTAEEVVAAIHKLHDLEKQINDAARGLHGFITASIQISSP